MSLKDGKLGALLSAQNSLAGNLSDLSGFAATKVMSAYCEQFTWPVKAHMKAQFFQDGNKWWEYSFDLRGRITVHYPKDAVGSSVPLKGRLEGYAYNFKVWENAMTVLYPNLMSSAVTKKIVIPPADLGEGAAVSEANAAVDSKQGGINIDGLQLGGSKSHDTIAVDVRILDADTGDVLDSVNVTLPVKASSIGVSGTAALANTIAAARGGSASPFTPDVSTQSSNQAGIDSTVRGCIDAAVLELAKRVDLPTDAAAQH